MPRPRQAQITPNAPCAPIKATVGVCRFGFSGVNAGGAIALVGDSHAEHWRAALEVVTQALHWSGLSITQPSCPFTHATAVAPEPKRVQCTQWNQGVVQWFDQHPEINTVFTSDHPGPVLTSPGQNQQDAKVAGITSAWNALPATVKHIIVIRDVPFINQDTLPCVERAIAKREDAGLACALPRGRAVHRDPDVVAAQQLRSPRVQVVDLTQFLCGSRLCYPVVGGALVYRDFFDHLTRVFATTLGPFLLDQVARLMATWH
ncbi:MAG TPA: SGNH hydrolase domain-containing protein [Solirubrobacteraceae bacterium]|nr:SGNH hydrolase domain-containing protein [Solirubrobacteraceae bacterium]